jgi:hypothetical protein
MTRASVREYAILYLGGSSTGGGATLGGGNAILKAGQHELEGSEHTNKPGALLVKREIAPATLTADANDWAPTGLEAADVVRVAGDDAWSVTGIDAPGVAYALLLENVGAYALTLEHDSASSAAANRIRCPSGIDLSVPANGAVLVAYDVTDGCWRVIGAAGGGAVAALEDGVTVVVAASAVDFRSGVRVSDLGGGYARVDVRGRVAVHGNAGSSEVLDHDDGTTHDLTLDAATCALTIVATTTLPTGRECALTVVLRQDATGGRLVDWSGITIAWQGDTEPPLSTAPDAVDVVSLVTLDGGSSYLGFYGVVPPAPVDLDDLTDVDTSSTPPADGQALLWDDGASLWVPGNVATTGGSEVGSVLLIADGTADFLTTEDGTAFLSMG